MARVRPSGHVGSVNLTRLRMLSEIGSRGTFSAAAAAMDYTPSAVSQQIALLERETGVRLVERGPRGAQLTDAGRLLARHADVALLELAKARQALDRLTSAGTGRLRLAAFSTAMATIVAHAARSFGEAYPDCAIEVVDAEPDVARAMLAARQVDAAVVYDFEPGGEGELIGDDPVLLCLPAGHPLAGHQEIDLADLAGEQWFGGDASPWVPGLVEQCRAVGFTPAFSPLLTNDYAAMQGLVAAHHIVGLIPELALTTTHPGVVIRDLRPRPRPRTIRYAADPANPAVDGFRDHLRDALARRV
jgi:DNA-binding transcriptional LysR family regulator